MSKSLAKFLALLAAGALLLAACGGGDTTSSDGSDDESTDTTEADDSDDEAMADDDDAMADDDEAMADDDAAAGDDCASEELLCVGLVTDLGKVDDKTVGFALGEATLTSAAETPQTYYVGVDQFQGAEVPNVAGLIFPEDQAGFLAGALAGLVTETDVVGQVLGTDLVPPVVAFKEGFEAGVAYTNPDAELISTYHPGGLDVAFTDPDWGASTARQALDNNADVIFGAGGSTGNGALAEIAKEGGDAYCIGVDTDQWETVPEAHPCPPGVVDIVAAQQGGDAPTGNFVGEVGLADYHDFSDVIDADVQSQIADLTPKVLSGEVPTGYGS